MVREMLKVHFWQVFWSSMINPVVMLACFFIAGYFGLQKYTTNFVYAMVVIVLRYFVEIAILRGSYFVFKLTRKEISFSQFILSFTKAHRVFNIFIIYSWLFLFWGNRQGSDAAGLGFFIFIIFVPLSVITIPLSIIDFYRQLRKNISGQEITEVSIG